MGDITRRAGGRVGRLTDDVDRPFEGFFPLLQQARGRKHRRHVKIMTAGVHLPFR